MYSVGIGLTNNCNLNCAHCYREREKIHNLALEDVRTVVESIDVGSMGFGTGENGMNPEYFEIIEYLHSKGIKLTLASNGHTLSMTPDDMLGFFGDVEFSLDFPDAERQDAFRGRGNFGLVTEGIERCRRLGIRVSVLAVLMNLNYKDLGGIAGLAASMGADFRVNVYQPAFTYEFMPDFDQYWEAFGILFENSEIVSVTEPLVKTFLGIKAPGGTPCGSGSLRITPDGKLKPCVYWPESDLTIEDLVEKKSDVFKSPLFLKTRTVPAFCENCRHVSICGGGCASRRLLRKSFDRPDEYCPIAAGKTVALSASVPIDSGASGASKPLRMGSICTTIVRGTGR